MIYDTTEVMPLLVVLTSTEVSARQTLDELETAGRIVPIEPPGSNDVQVEFEVVERRQVSNRRGISAERRAQ